MKGIIRPSGVLRNLLVLPRPLDFLSNYKKLISAKGLGEFRRASWHMIPMSKRSDNGLGILNTYGGLFMQLRVTASGLRSNMLVRVPHAWWL